MGDTFNDIYKPDVTVIQNTFFNDYLSDADPYYLKVYFYLLWKKTGRIDIERAADDLNLTINDVERAIKYWINKKVISKEMVKQEENVLPNRPNLVSFKEKRDELLSRKDDEAAFNDLIFFAEKVLPNTMSSPQLQALREMYSVMKLPVEVIEYLIEYIAQNETYSSKYMLTIANSWYEQGIKSRNEAKAFTEKFGKDKKTKKTTKTRKRSGLERSIDDYTGQQEISLENKDMFK